MSYDTNQIQFVAYEGSVRVFADADTHFYTDGKGRYGCPAGLAIKINGWWTMLSPDGYSSEINVEFDEKTYTDRDSVICTDQGFLKQFKNHLVDYCNVPSSAVQDLEYAPIDRQITGRVVFEMPGALDTWFRDQIQQQLINPESIFRN